MMLLQGATARLVGMLSRAEYGQLSTSRVKTGAIVRHLAAGTVFAGLVGDVLQRLLQTKSLWGSPSAWSSAPLDTGHQDWRGENRSGATLAPFIVANVLIDGVSMGLSAATGSSVTIVFVIALAPELALLGLTLSEELGGAEWGAMKRICTPALIGLGVVVGGSNRTMSVPESP